MWRRMRRQPIKSGRVWELVGEAKRKKINFLQRGRQWGRRREKNFIKWGKFSHQNERTALCMCGLYTLPCFSSAFYCVQEVHNKAKLSSPPYLPMKPCSSPSQSRPTLTNKLKLDTKLIYCNSLRCRGWGWEHLSALVQKLKRIDKVVMRREPKRECAIIGRARTINKFIKL